MPKFILPDGIAPYSNLHAIDFRRLIKTEENKSDYRTTSLYLSALSYEHQWQLSDIITSLTAPGEGDILPFLRSREIVRAFDNEPGSYTIDLGNDDFDKFIDRVKNHHPSPGPLLEPCFHIYIGKKTGESNFNIVIVPAFFDRVAADHSTDIESSAFPPDGFFAYIIANGINKISGDVDECASYIVDKDLIPADNPTQVVFYSLDAFEIFKGNLDGTAKKLFIEFGRDRGRCVLVLTFLDELNEPIRCKITSPFAQGVCFDQGDLMPPPPNSSDWDTSF